VIDHDTAASTPVHAYVDGAPVVLTADRIRGDVAAAYPGSGARHGFDAVIPVPAGEHRVCVYGIDVGGPGANTTLGCRSVTVGGSPRGSLDAVRAGPQSVQVEGWVFDRDLASPGVVHVYVDGVGAVVTADRPRADVGQAFPLYGTDHGFQPTIPAAPGLRRVCVYAIDVAGPGANALLGCRTLTVGGSPFGRLDAASAGSGSVRVSGWAIDPDTSGPATVHVYVDGVARVISAGASRADVGRAYPRYGDRHGFDATIPMAPGARRVCAYGVNTAGPGGNATLGCRTITPAAPFALTSVRAPAPASAPLATSRSTPRVSSVAAALDAPLSYCRLDV